jgi:aryl-alcohol dehydrogenase-like predicted oxidoreductase
VHEPRSSQQRLTNTPPADFYGDSELLIGRWLALNPEKRKDIFLATKFGAAIKPENSTPAYCKQQANASLQRLGTDYIDLFYIHRLDRVTPVEQTVRAMVELKNEGKIRWLGISECSPTSLRRANKVHQFQAVQMEYSPFALEIEQEPYNILATARDLGVAVVAYSPIGRGILTGSIRSHDDLADDDFRKIVPRYSKENFPKNLELVDIIGAIAKEKGVTPSQLTLAWLLAQGEDIFAIPGTTKVHRLEENIGALSVELSAEEVKTIRDAVEKAGVKGERYPPGWDDVLFADTPEET